MFKNKIILIIVSFMMILPIAGFFKIVTNFENSGKDTTESALQNDSDIAESQSVKSNDNKAPARFDGKDFNNTTKVNGKNGRYQSPAVGTLSGGEVSGVYDKHAIIEETWNYGQFNSDRAENIKFQVDDFRYEYHGIEGFVVDIKKEAYFASDNSSGASGEFDVSPGSANDITTDWSYAYKFSGMKFRFYSYSGVTPNSSTTTPGSLQKPGVPWSGQYGNPWDNNGYVNWMLVITNNAAKNEFTIELVGDFSIDFKPYVSVGGFFIDGFKGSVEIWGEQPSYKPPYDLKDPEVTTTKTPIPFGNEGEIEIKGEWEYHNPDPIEYVEVFVDGVMVKKLELTDLSIDHKSFEWSMSNLEARTYDIQYKIHYKKEDGTSSPSHPKAISNVVQYKLEELEIPTFDQDPDYDKNDHYIKASPTGTSGIPHSNGEVTLSGSYNAPYGTDSLVHTVQTRMCFDTENNCDSQNTWEPWKETDEHTLSNGSFKTKLTGIPAGPLNTQVRLVYDSHDSGTDDDAVVKYGSPIFMTMEESENPSLDSTSSQVFLTAKPTYWIAADKSAINVESTLHDPDDQIDEKQNSIQVWSKKTGSSGDWKKEDATGSYNTTTKALSHDVEGLEPLTEYEIKIVVNTRANQTIEGYSEFETTMATSEIPIEPATPTVDSKTNPSWGLLIDGTITGTINFPNPIDHPLTVGTEVTKVSAYLRNENDENYSFNYEETDNFTEIETVGETTITFEGSKDNPIKTSDGYYIEIEWVWKSNDGKEYTSGIEYPSGNSSYVSFPNKRSITTIEVETAEEAPPEMDISHDDLIITNPTHLDKTDGKIEFNFEIINNYNSRIKSFEIRLLKGDVFEQSLSFFKPEGNKHITGQFKNLSHGGYKIKVYATYEINAISYSNEHIDEILNINVDSALPSPPQATIYDITAKDLSKKVSEDYVPPKSDDKVGSDLEDYGSIKVDFIIENKYNATFLDHENGTKIQLNKWDETIGEIGDWKFYDDEPIETKDITGSKTHKFVGLREGTYQIQIISNFKTDPNGEETTNEIIEQTNRIQINEPSDISLYATKKVTTTDGTFEVVLKIIDIESVLVENSLDIIIFINGEQVWEEQDQPLSEKIINFKYGGDVNNYEIKISADYKDETLGSWTGDEVWKENTYVLNKLEDNDLNSIIIASIISGVVILTFGTAALIYFKKP